MNVSPLGASDCERLRDGAVAQPVNTVSSLVYLVAGVWVLQRARQADPAERPWATAYGSSLLGLGVGSVGFHGPGTASARWLHDLSLADTVLVIAVLNAVLALDVPAADAWRVYLAVLTGCSVLFAVLPDTSIATTVAIALAALASEVAVRRSGAPARLRRAGARRTAYRLGLAALGSGALVNALSRTGGPLCKSDSLFQGHALWHLLTGLAAACWFPAAVPALGSNRNQSRTTPNTLPTP